MTPTTLEAQPADWLEDLEAWHLRRCGSVSEARRQIARATGLSQGTLEGVRRKRLKGVRLHVFDAIRGAFCAALEAEQRRLAHALDLAERGMGGVDKDAAREARAALEQARDVIETGRRP